MWAENNLDGKGATFNFVSANFQSLINLILTRNNQTNDVDNYKDEQIVFLLTLVLPNFGPQGYSISLNLRNYYFACKYNTNSHDAIWISN
jgi:hypothetical protein